MKCCNIMESNVFQCFSTKPTPSIIPIQTSQSRVVLPRRQRFLTIKSVDSSNNDESPPQTSITPPPTITSPETVGVRFKRRSRRKRERREGGDNGGKPAKAQASDAPKKWEEKSLGEKAVELYVGEKGLLFWLNKFAYASIFIVIGGWIVFRFVGPALNLYQLDTPPLSPNNMFKG